MKNPFEASGFQIELTMDGSPTLKASTGESMHHSGGAAAETWYIYGSVIQKALQIIPNANICTIGLGLGYIEMATALISENPNIDTFEIVPELVSQFQNWINNRPSEAIEIYNLAFDKLAVGNSLVTRAVAKKRLVGIHFHADVKNFKDSKKWDIICFDAFSKKTSEDLWMPEFLNQFLREHAADDCVLTTYARTGNLNKALLDHGFTLSERPGFSGKRESTLAVRGHYIPCFPNFLM